jgi:hypothetical protein
MSNGRARHSNDAAGRAAQNREHAQLELGRLMLWLAVCPDPSCVAPAEIPDRITVGSTDGPVEHVRTLCLDGHRFYLPADRVPWPPPVAGSGRPARSGRGQSG